MIIMTIMTAIVTMAMKSHNVVLTMIMTMTTMMTMITGMAITLKMPITITMTITIKISDDEIKDDSVNKHTGKFSSLDFPKHKSFLLNVQHQLSKVCRIEYFEAGKSMEDVFFRV